MCSALTYCQRSNFNLLALQAQEKHREYYSKILGYKWELLPTSVDCSRECSQRYFGVSFFKKTDVGYELVFAHQGSTTTDFISNIFLDVSFSEQRDHSSLIEAQQYIANVCSEFRSKHNVFSSEKVTISHTGFSYGGVIAVDCANFEPKTQKAVIFDAPGASSLQTHLYTPEVTNYVTTPNLVNTSGGRHLGVVVQVSIPLELPLTDSISANFNMRDLNLVFTTDEVNKNTELADWEAAQSERQQKKATINAAIAEISRTLDSHVLDKIIAAFFNNNQIRKIRKWPQATNNIIYGKEADLNGPRPTGGSFLQQFERFIKARPPEKHTKFWQLSSLPRWGRLGVMSVTHRRNNKIHVFEEAIKQTDEQQGKEFSSAENEIPMRERKKQYT